MGAGANPGSIKRILKILETRWMPADMLQCVVNVCRTGMQMWARHLANQVARFPRLRSPAIRVAQRMRVGLNFPE